MSKRANLTPEARCDRKKPTGTVIPNPAIEKGQVVYLPLIFASLSARKRPRLFDSPLGRSDAGFQIFDSQFVVHFDLQTMFSFTKSFCFLLSLTLFDQRCGSYKLAESFSVPKEKAPTGKSGAKEKADLVPALYLARIR